MCIISEFNVSQHCTWWGARHLAQRICSVEATVHLQPAAAAQREDDGADLCCTELPAGADALVAPPCPVVGATSPSQWLQSCQPVSL